MAYNDLPPLGQTTKSASLPVTIASDQDVVATSAKQDTLLTELQLKADLSETQPVSLATVPSHAVTNAGTFAVQATEADGANTTLGAKTDAKSTATDATAVSAMSVLKQISASVQAPPTQAVTFTGSTDVATQTTLALIKAKTDNIPAQGQALAAASVPVVLTAAQLTTLTPPAQGLTDTQLRATAVPVSVATIPSHAVTNAGTFVTQVDGAALTALQLIDDTVFADDAAFTLGTSKGTAIEGVSVAMDGTDPTAVSAEGDAAALRSDPNRILLVNQTHPRFFNVSADYAAAQTNATVQAAPGAGLSLYITDLVISNGATAGNITLLDGSGGTVKFELYPAVNGGVSMSFRNPIKLTANTLLAITSTTVTSHSVFVSGYIAA